MPIEYEDVEVEVSRSLWQQGGEEQLEVRILQSPFDRPKEQFTRPFSAEELEAFFTEWDRLLLTSGAPAAQRRRKLAEEMGTRIYHSLFYGKTGDTFSSCLADLDGSRRARTGGLRIRISFGQREHYLPELVGLPWELLYWKDTNSFLGHGLGTPIARYLDVPRRIHTLEIDAPLKVLAVLSAPTDQPPINLERQRKGLQAALLRQPWVTLNFLDGPATLDRLRDRLQKGHYNALHFLGHGAFDEDSGDGVLFFERPDGKSHQVTGRDLATQLNRIDSLRLVVLSSCLGARMLRSRDQNSFAGVASALVADGLPAVVAMQFPVSEQAALTFSASLYSKLGEECTIDEAVAEARTSIQASDRQQSSFEWAAPVLFLRAPDGKIISFKNRAELPSKRISIFNIMDFGRNGFQDADWPIDLTSYFKDGSRFPEPPEIWHTGILQTLAEQLDQMIDDNHSYVFDLAAPASVAFAAGYQIQIKKSVGAAVIQRGQGTEATWSANDPVPQGAAVWSQGNRAQPGFPLTSGSRDIAVVIEVSNPVLPAVASYLQRAELNPPAIGSLIYATLKGEPGHRTIHGGGHAYQFAEKLCNRIHRAVAAQPGVTVHIFASAPNALLFFMGRMSRKFPRIQLYEHDFEANRNVIYAPSITLFNPLEA